MTAAYTSLVPYYGAKRTLAPRIVEALGPHRCYWEPFCGSLAVLLAKPVVMMETANDLNADIVNLARVVSDRHAAADLHWRLLRTLPSQQLFRDAMVYLRAAPPLALGGPIGFICERAYYYLVASWLGMNGVVGSNRIGSSFAKRFTSRGGSPGTRFAGMADSLPWWHERLRAVTVLSEDGIGLCERIEDRDGTVIYCDPPYIAKGAEYLHDFDEPDHRRLANVLRRFRHTRVVVSYYAHPRLAELYPGWRVVSCATAKAMVNSGKRPGGKATVAPEVLLINRAGPDGLFA